jgi:hypothetical protein
MRTIANIFWLGTKELRSFLHDFVLLALVIYSFSLAIIAQAQSNSQEVHNASVGVVDEDRSELSRRIAQAFLPPYFQKPQPIAERDIVPLMNAGRYTFALDIPPHFERDVLGGREPGIMAHSHQATESSTYGRPRLRYTVESRGPFIRDRCRGTTLPHVRGGADAVAGRSLRSVRRRSAQDALRDAVA